MKDDLDIKLNANGDIDLDYYTLKAEQLRAEYNVEMYRNAIRAVKSFFSSLIDKFLSNFLKTSH